MEAHDAVQQRVDTGSPRAPRFWRDNLLINGAGVVAGLSNVAYHMVVARLLGPSSYGVLQALTTLAVVLQAPVSLVTLVYTRRGARRDELWRLVALWSGAGVVLWLGVVVSAPVIAQVFHLPPTLLILYTGSVVPSFVYGMALGLMQWAALFSWAGGVTVWGALGRMLTTLVVYWKRWGLTGLSVMPPLVGLTGAGLAAAGARTSVRTARELHLPHFGGLFNAAVVGLLVLLLTSADVLVAKHSLSSHAAGLYGGLSTMGRAPAYFASAVGVVLLSSAQRDPTHRFRYLWRSLGLVAGLAVGGVLLYSFWGIPLIRLSLGSRFTPLDPHLVPFTLAMGIQGLELVLLYFGAAREWRMLSVTAALGLGVWLAALWVAPTLNAAIGRTVWAMTGLFLLSVVVVLWGEVRGHRESRSAGERGPARS